MSWTRDLVEGAATLLAARVPGLTWRPSGAYTGGETGIVVKTMPQAPDRVVVLTQYDVDNPPGSAHVLTGLQVRCRAGVDPRDVDDLADAIRDVLHGAESYRIGLVWIAKSWRNSHTSTGADSGGRWTTSSNYYLLATRASAALHD